MMELDNIKITSEISTYDEGNPILIHIINDCRYSFSIKDFPKERQEWLRTVLTEHYKELYERTRRETIKEMQMKFKILMGL